MKATGLVSLFVLMLFTISAHADDVAQPAAEKGQVLFEHGIRVVFPQAYQLNKSQIGPQPEDLQLQYASTFPNGVHMVTVQTTDAPLDKQPELKKAYFEVLASSFQKAIGGTRKLEKNAGIEELEGRMFGFSIPAKQGKCLSLMFLENGRWYHVFAMGTQEFVQSASTVEFLTSVQLQLRK